MGRYPKWTEEEHAYLEELVGNYPFCEVVKRYQSAAKRNDWPWRSEDAIKVRVGRHIGSRKAIDKNFTYHTLAKILGYNRDRVRQWYRNGKLKVVKVGYITKVTDSALQAFAKEYPELLSDADWTGLAFLFGEKKANQIKSFPSVVTSPKPVRCMKTGTIYPSIRDAAKHCYLHKSSVRRRAEKRSGFEFLEVV